MRPVEPTNAEPFGKFNARSVNETISRASRQTLFSRAGVRISRIHDDDLRHSAFHAFDTNFHRRGADLVRREHSGDGRGRFGNNERKVALLSFIRAFARAKSFDVAKHAAGEKAFWRDD